MNSHASLAPMCKKTLGAVLGISVSWLCFGGIGTSLLQTAPVIEPNRYELKTHADVIFSNGGGFNLSQHIRTGLVDHLLDVDAFVGTGTTDFQLGGLAKYNFLPDIEGQVGLSFLGGLSIIRDEGNAGFALSSGALVSKQFPVQFGSIEPYGALQLELFMVSDNSQLPITILGGSKWTFVDLEPWSFYSELSVSLHESLTGIAIGAAYPF